MTDYDYSPPAEHLYAVVSTEHEPPIILGTWLGTTEDTVSYFDSGPDEEHHSAPADCVRLVRVDQNDLHHNYYDDAV